MSNDHETASAFAQEAGKALLPGGISTSIFGVVGGLLGAHWFDESYTYSCYNVISGESEIVAGYRNPNFSNYTGCRKVLDMPLVGPIFDPVQAGLILGTFIAFTVGVVALAYIAIKAAK
ncbi:hypothetical protein [Streptomyces hokutonensis]|uniref:Uncharacterized protein n=1 Tax=Streptomyces hokutonensis TaxID=1306990 RepID=A0ABW6M2A8_9ACTN